LSGVPVLLTVVRLCNLVLHVGHVGTEEAVIKVSSVPPSRSSSNTELDVDVLKQILYKGRINAIY
jgi:hypothetical protein